MSEVQRPLSGIEAGKRVGIGIQRPALEDQRGYFHNRFEFFPRIHSFHKIINFPNTFQQLIVYEIPSAMEGLDTYPSDINSLLR